jgi:hypothetical protein
MLTHADVCYADARIANHFNYTALDYCLWSAFDIRNIAFGEKQFFFRAPCPDPLRRKGMLMYADVC